MFNLITNRLHKFPVVNNYLFIYLSIYVFFPVAINASEQNR